jgi:hypothetical protein
MTLTMDFYPILRMKCAGNIVLLQPWWNGKSVDRCLSCDLSTGSVQYVDDQLAAGYQEVFGVLGMIRMKSASAIVVATAVKEVAELRGFPVFVVQKTRVLGGSGAASADKVVFKSLRAAVDPSKYGHGMYISAGGDLSLTYQKHHVTSAQKDSASAWLRADPLLCWNRTLAMPLIEAGAEKFVPIVVKGFFEQLKGVPVSGSFINLTVFARRSARRPGTRQWRRGADAEANVANFVESEQIVEFDDGSVSSFVQVRGSIPVMWSQTPNLKYKIPIAIGPSGRSEAVLKSHISSLSKTYGFVTAINLANLTGREGKLSSAYASAAAAVSKEVDGFTFIAFDFHKECGATNYANLSKLWDRIKGDYSSYGSWSRSSTGEMGTQSGIFRTNCIDTLDRTNVVQGLLARKSLERELASRGLLAEGKSFESASPELERLFRAIWADHGDEISRQYAGTGAMKSAFTRTGKRDLFGLMDDGAKSMTRYFLNNFRDGEKQDALDLVTGTYRPERDGTGRWMLKMSPAIPLLVATLLLYTAHQNFISLVRVPREVFSPIAIRHVWALMALAFAIFNAIRAFGRFLVDRPAFRPDLSVPWEKI